jgi:homoserine dehydrogenase
LKSVIRSNAPRNLQRNSSPLLTEIEKRGASMDSMIEEAQRLGYAEADPSADLDGYDARSTLVLLAALAFGILVPLAQILEHSFSNTRTAM